MDLMNLLGGRMLWLGDGDSLQNLALQLMPEQYRLTLDIARVERAEHEQRAARRKEQRSKDIQQYAGSIQELKAAGFDVRGMYDEDEDEDEEKYRFHSATYKVDNGVAIIGISGALVNSESWLLRYMGKVGYPHIVDQLVRAYNDPEVSSILMDINSPGGAANGISMVSDVINAVNQTKPVTAFTESQMCSGGYWMGVSARHITSSRMAEVGSIGVVMTHIEYSKMMEKAGVTANVIRKGEYKALMTPYEPLTEKARAEADKAMDVIYDEFTMHVAVGRRVSQDTVKSSMAEGRVFWGQEALQANLVDKIGDIGAALAYSRSLVQTSPATV